MRRNKFSPTGCTIIIYKDNHNYSTWKQLHLILPSFEIKTTLPVPLHFTLYELHAFKGIKHSFTQETHADIDRKWEKIGLAPATFRVTAITLPVESQVDSVRACKIAMVIAFPDTTLKLTALDRGWRGKKKKWKVVRFYEWVGNCFLPSPFACFLSKYLVSPPQWLWTHSKVVGERSMLLYVSTLG